MSSSSSSSSSAKLSWAWVECVACPAAAGSVGVVVTIGVVHLQFATYTVTFRGVPFQAAVLCRGDPSRVVRGIVGVSVRVVWLQV